ncbi:MAG: LEA type 2 family protein [Archangium sp.]|nr:LEA type 2 family protein [Archangium sp.]
MRAPFRLGLTVAVAVSSLVACKSAPPPKPTSADPTFTAENLAIVTQTLTDCTLGFTGTLESPEVPFTATSARLEVVVDGNVVATKDVPLSLQVGAGEKGEVAFEHSFTVVKDAEELKSMDARGGSLLIALRGAVLGTVTEPAEGENPATTRTIEVAFARSKDVRTPRLPHLKLVDFEAGRFSESEVQAVFHVGVVNPNPFQLTLNEFTYEVQLAGKKVAEGVMGKGEKISPASTGVFDVTATLNEESHGKDVKKLIKGLVVPYVLSTTMKTAMYAEPLESKGDIKLNASK